MRFWHVFVAAILAAVFAAALSCADVGSGGDDDDDAGPGPGDDDDDTGASDDDADDDAGDDDLGPDDVYFGRYVVIAYPDSGVSWYLQDFSEFALFPPGNNLRAQVIERSDPPVIVSDGFRLSFEMAGNTTSQYKTNFWAYAGGLFGVSPEPDVGVTGTRFFGDLTAGEDDIWSVAGIPLTPLTDDLEYDPYPLARVTLWDVNEAVAQTVAVLPVSWEVSCKTCHYSPGITAEIDVLRDHDTAFGTTLEADRPVFCASCHYSKPMAAYTAGDPEVSTLSQAIHTSHAEYMEALGSETNYCYACHPGFEYPHQRDVHAKPHNIACGACHGQQMTEIGRVTREAWVELPRCITCHSEDVDLDFEPEGVPYKNARGHGGVLCATCHGPQHAYWPATTTQDAIQPIGLQGHSGYIDDCLVCHATEPDAPFEHRDFTAKKNRPPKWAPIPTASR